jgi:putative SOS response-associated peptidase YedK
VCANYIPVTRADRLLAFFGVTRERDDPPLEVYPTQIAPFIRLAEDGSGPPQDRSQGGPAPSGGSDRRERGGNHQLRCDDAFFGLLPHFAAEIAFGRRTYNARSETVAKLASFRDAWARGQRCIVPAECIFEPRYGDDGKATRWAIGQPGDVPLGIAGIYTRWRAPAREGASSSDASWHFSFAMLTVNADDHPVMKQFHAPGEEKRMVVILDPKDWGTWLSCPVGQATAFLRPWSGPLTCREAPRPPRAPSAGSVRTVRPAAASKAAPADDRQGSLLD